MGTPTIHSRTILFDPANGYNPDIASEPNEITSIAMGALDDQKREPVEYRLQFMQPTRTNRHYPEVLALLQELQGTPRKVELPTEERRPNAADDYLQALYNKGYTTLALALDGWDGWPWDEIRNLNYAPLVQQLYDLVHLTNGQEQQRELISLALETARSASDSESVEAAVERLGKLTYLIDRGVTSGILEGNDHEASLRRIDELFGQELQLIQSKLKKHFQAHHATHLQNSTHARATLLPKLFAESLLLGNGTLNFGLIGAIRHQLLTEKDLTLGFAQEIDASLSILQHSPELRDKLATVTISENRSGNAYALACHALGVPPTTELTDVDAKRVALGALLSHIRQGHVGSCFATYLGIEVMRARLGRCLDDLSEILRDGYVTTISERGVEEQHPILLRLSHDERDEALRLNQEGSIMTPMGILLSVWKAPGIRSACIAAGIEESAIEAVCRGAVQKCWDQAGGSQSSVRVSHYNFMKFIALTAEELEMGSRGTLYQKMVIGFEAQTCNPLLRCWEYSLASMAESQNDSFLRERQLGALSATLARNLDMILFGQGEIKRHVRGQVLLAFVENTVLRYDPSLNGLDGASDGNSTSGGFVLYDKMGSSNPDEWVRVDSSQKFRECVTRAIRVTKERVPTLPQHESDQVLMEMILDSLRNFAESESSSFITNCLSVYLRGNIHGSISGSPDRLPHTLWVDRIGNMPDQVWKVYFGEEIVSHEKVIPYGAEGLLKKIVARCASANETTKERFRQNPLLEVPAGTTAQHAFSLMPGHPSLKPLWENPEFGDEWIRENLEEPGKAIAEITVTPHVKARICKALENEIVDESRRSLFAAGAEALPDTLTYSQLRNKLLFSIQRSGAVRDMHPARLRAKVDSLLFRHLPYSQRKKVHESAIHFADTNWNHDEHDVHFAFIYSPFTRRIEVWKVHEDGTSASAINQAAWVTRRWEIPNDLGEPLPEEGEEVAVLDWTPFYDPFGVDDPRMVS